MHLRRSIVRPEQLAGLSGISLLALILAGCGAPEQRAAAPTSAGRPSAISAPARPSATVRSIAATTAPSPSPTRGAQAAQAPSAPAPSSTPPPPQAPTQVPRQRPATPTAPLAKTPAPAAGQQIYRSQAAGYSVAYPADWTASEQAGADGGFVTTFTPRGGGAAITIIVRLGEQVPQPSDIPNTRCRQITVGGLAAARCFDTISLGTSTTLVGKGKTFTIAAPGKRTDPNVYQQILDSFAAG